MLLFDDLNNVSASQILNVAIIYINMFLSQLDVVCICNSGTKLCCLQEKFLQVVKSNILPTVNDRLSSQRLIKRPITVQSWGKISYKCQVYSSAQLKPDANLNKRKSVQFFTFFRKSCLTDTLCCFYFFSQASRLN